MPANYYEDLPDDTAEMRDGGANGSASGGVEASEDAQDNARTALIPESLCPGMDVGDTIELRVVAAHEDEYEVEYVKGDGGDGPRKGEPSMERARARNEGVGRGDGSMSNYLED